jgi:spore coat polysaccharide biosynthesis protein SpsF
MRIVATIEARTGSIRFPGKVLKHIGEETVLEWTVKRLQMAKRIDAVIVATTVNASDDQIVDVCKQKHIPYYRGSEEDVLERISGAARTMDANVIVQSGADCPFYDPDIVDQLVKIFLQGNYDYVCNDLEEGYPIGVNIHVLSAETLYEVEQLAILQKDRENVVTFIWDHTDNYRIYNLTPPSELRRPDIRLTVDYSEDLVFLNEVFKGIGDNSFRTIDIIRFINKNSHLLDINKNCKMKKESCAYNIV